MKIISIEKLIEITNGILINKGFQKDIYNIKIDSRNIEHGDLFVPLKGENTDGHLYIKNAINNGASACLSEKKVDVGLDCNIILVENSLEALHKIARYYRKQFSIPFIALTGSSGKTTTKDIIASILSVKHNTLKTIGNYNNELGVPLTLFNLDDDHEIAVVEMGMNHSGEIKKLVNLVFPDIAIITNIGKTHIEHLGTQENIFKAKCEILETLSKRDIALLNGDDKFLKEVDSSEYLVKKIGILEDNLDLKAQNITSNENGISFEVINKDNEKFTYKFKLPGIHNVYNCLLGIFIGKKYGLSNKEIQIGLNNYSPSKLRMDIIKTDKHIIINDTYNANPDSMKAAIDVLKEMGNKSRTVAILGDMLEMGSVSTKFHMEVGEYCVDKEIDIVIAVGKLASDYLINITKDNVETYHFDSNNDVKKALNNILKVNDVILVKGSRGMRMENIVRGIQEGR